MPALPPALTPYPPPSSQEFDGERSPDLQKDVYLQDIHCVSSLCKAYFRELPNPLLTYRLYDRFAVSPIGSPPVPWGDTAGGRGVWGHRGH